MVSDLALPELEPFATGGRSRAPASAPPPPGGRLVFDGRGRVGTRETEVRCRQADGGYLLEVGGNRFAIAAGGRRIECLPGGSRDEVLDRHTVVGPCLCLALALKGCFCLHAAAVVREGWAVALVGPSGAGKSTLAGWLAAAGSRDPRGWRRAADDVLPVRRSRRGPSAAPHFPQLGLAAEEQWASDRPASLPLAAVYRLRPVAAGREPALTTPGRRAAVLALVRHSVAARLFAPDLLALHLDFCRALAEELPVRELSLPRDRGQLGAVAELLAGDLG